MNGRLLARLAIVCLSLAFSTVFAKERIIVTTDGEYDDRASLIRLLVYANEIDIAGLIYTNSQFHHSGVNPVDSHRRGNGWIESSISSYEASLGNLRVHADGWPSGSQLRSVIRNGNLGAPNGGFGPVYDNGAVGENWDTEGSDLIVRTLLDGDSRRVWLQAWGGLSTIAQAFYRLRASYSQSQLDYAISKARIYAVVEQEHAFPYGAPTYGLTGPNSEWLQHNFPNLQIVQPLVQPWLFAYMGNGRDPGRNMGTAGGQYADAVNWNFNAYEMQSSWYGSHAAGHGSLGQAYHYTNSEGDSLAFFHVLNNGLRAYENPTWGGWGGRMRSVGVKFWTDAYDDGNRGKGFWRWIPDLQSDFGARMDWAMHGSYQQANHAPVVNAQGSARREVAPGQRVALGVSASDPDGNALSYNWYHYRDAGDNPYTNTTISLGGASTANASLTIPGDAMGREIHVLVEVKDNGIGHPLKTYQRFILEVTGNASADPTPSVPSTPAAPTTPGAPGTDTDESADKDEAAVSAGANLLVNASFEDGKTSPWVAWGSFAPVSSGAHTGSRAIVIAPGSGGGSNVRSLKPGGSYVYSAWGRVAGGSAGARIGYKFYDASFNQIGSTVASDSFSANYEKRQLRFVMPANAQYAQVYVWNAARGTLTFDDVALTGEQGGTAQPEPTAPVTDTSEKEAAAESSTDKALINDGFESGAIGHWRAWGSFYPTDDGNAHTGNWAVRVLPGNGGGTNVLDVQPGGSYEFSGWGKALRGDGARLGVKFYNAAYNQIGAAQHSSSFTSQYQRRAIAFTVPAGAIYAQVFGWNNSQSSLYLDDLAVTAR